MSGSKGRFSTNLGLAILPELTDADPRLYQEFVNVYNAIKSLAVNLDRYTGLEYRDDIQQAQYSIDPVTNTFLLGNVTKMYKIAGEALSYGNFVYINAAGQVMKARGGNSVAAITEYKRAMAVVTGAGVLSGEVVEIATSAIINTSGLITGRRYQLNDYGGIADWWGYYRTNGVAVTAFFQDVGIALSNTTLLVDIDKTVYWGDSISGTISIALQQGAITFADW
jgi:hypothetical protein